MPLSNVRSATWVTLTLGTTAALMGCTPIAADEATNPVPTRSYALASTNGLAMINGLSMTNGLAMSNGLALANGLAMSNGLAMANGLPSLGGYMNTDAGRQTVAYMVRCALDASQSVVKQDQYGSSYTFQGMMNLAPEWEWGACGGSCQQWVSACMLAHVNTAGVHIPIWLVGQHPEVGWGQNPDYPNQEGTFFGNIFETNTAGHTDAYYCNGPGFDRDVVAGRIGAAQSGAPYRNLFASGYCHVNGCVPSDARTKNVADGYKACTMGDGATNAWNTMLTVWRQNKAFDARGQLIANKTADGGTIRYDFESGSLNGWTATNTQLHLSSTGEASDQTGSQSLKAEYGSGASTLRMESPAGLSIAGGTQVSFYVFISAASALNSISPYVKKQGGGEVKIAMPTVSMLKGSWNVVTIMVPSGATGAQVGVEYQTGGAFVSYLDSVTW